MKPIDLRNATWESIQGLITGYRRAVLEGWRMHGPGTTQRIANRCGISVLTFRPRTTELLQLGLIRLTGREENEGVYEAVPPEECRASFEKARADAIPLGEQMPLKL